MSEFQSIVEAIAKGKNPILAIDELMAGERHDDIQSEADKLAAFHKITGTIQDYKGYVGIDWITRIADQVKQANPAGMGELADLARRNRDGYSESNQTDKGGNFGMWDAIYRGILALRTDELPPS